jgi:hypothetical protein
MRSPCRTGSSRTGSAFCCEARESACTPSTTPVHGQTRRYLVRLRSILFLPRIPFPAAGEGHSNRLIRTGPIASPFSLGVCVALAGETFPHQIATVAAPLTGGWNVA